MASINVTNILVHNNPCAYVDQFKFEITFECLSPIPDTIQWKLIYIGSAKDEKLDQTLESIEVGPLEYGAMKFYLQSSGPSAENIPGEDIMGITAILITCSYHNKEFIRVGYYINNTYDEQELLENPPTMPLIHKARRYILGDKPRVTRFPIDWEIVNDIPTYTTIGANDMYAQARNMMMSEENIAQAIAQ